MRGKCTVWTSSLAEVSHAQDHTTGVSHKRGGQGRRSWFCSVLWCSNPCRGHASQPCPYRTHSAPFRRARLSRPAQIRPCRRQSANDVNRGLHGPHGNRESRDRIRNVAVELRLHVSFEEVVGGGQ